LAAMVVSRFSAVSSIVDMVAHLSIRPPGRIAR
jgi:hypothetical protein